MPRKKPSALRVLPRAASSGLPLNLAIPSCSGNNISKRARFFARFRAMVEHGTWIYFPGKDLFVEKIGVQAAKWSPTRKARFMPPLHVYGREVYEASDPEWELFLQYHPLAVRKLHATFNVPSEGGLVDPDAFAIHDQEPVRGRYTGG